MAATTTNGLLDKIQFMLEREAPDWMKVVVDHDMPNDTWTITCRVDAHIHLAFDNQLKPKVYHPMPFTQQTAIYQMFPYVTDMKDRIRQMKQKLLEDLERGYYEHPAGKRTYFDDWYVNDRNGQILIQHKPKAPWRP